MPTSVPYCVPIIAGVARQLRPKSVLDVGIGFGKYGFLFREYLDVWDMKTVADYAKERWRTRIDGIDATREYVTPLHEYLYDNIHVGDVRTIIDTLGQYDVVIMGDVLEHFDKQAGYALIEKLCEHANQCVLLTFPVNCALNDNVLGNPYESHRAAWKRKDFRRFKGAEFKMVEGYTGLVAITKPPHRAPLLTASFAARRRTGWKGWIASMMVKTLGATQASRIASWLMGERVALRV